MSDLVETLRVTPRGDVCIYGEAAGNDPLIYRMVPHPNPGKATVFHARRTEDPEIGQHVLHMPKMSMPFIVFRTHGASISGVVVEDRKLLFGAIQKWAQAWAKHQNIDIDQARGV